MCNVATTVSPEQFTSDPASLRTLRAVSILAARRVPESAPGRWSLVRCTAVGDAVSNKLDLARWLQCAGEEVNPARTPIDINGVTGSSEAGWGAPGRDHVPKRLIA